MTVLELMRHLQKECFNGRGDYQFLVEETPFESQHFTIVPFSSRTDPDDPLLSHVTFTKSQTYNREQPAPPHD